MCFGMRFACFRPRHRAALGEVRASSSSLKTIFLLTLDNAFILIIQPHVVSEPTRLFVVFSRLRFHYRACHPLSKLDLPSRPLLHHRHRSPITQQDTTSFTCLPLTAPTALRMPFVFAERSFDAPSEVLDLRLRCRWSRESRCLWNLSDNESHSR